MISARIPTTADISLRQAASNAVWDGIKGQDLSQKAFSEM